MLTAEELYKTMPIVDHNALPEVQWRPGYVTKDISGPGNGMSTTLSYAVAEAGAGILIRGGVALGQAGVRSFKEGLSADRITYCVGRRIYDRAVYDRLSAARRRECPDSDVAFFP